MYNIYVRYICIIYLFTSPCLFAPNLGQLKMQIFIKNKFVPKLCKFKYYMQLFNSNIHTYIFLQSTTIRTN